jgi:hypothetical protein
VKYSPAGTLEFVTSSAVSIDTSTAGAQHSPETPAKLPRSKVPKWRGIPVTWLVFLPPAVLALSLIANGANQANERGNATSLAKKALAKAVKDVPFEVRLPKNLPFSAPLVRTFLDAPDSDQGFQAFQLNTWYTTPGLPEQGGGKTLHVWQSNDKFLARKLRDPLALKGKSIPLAGEVWHRVIDDRVSQRYVTTYSKRFDDGTTMTVDGEDPKMVEEVIKALKIEPVG